MLFDNLPIFLFSLFLGCTIIFLTIALVDETDREEREMYFILFLIFGFLTFAFTLIITDMV